MICNVFITLNAWVLALCPSLAVPNLLYLFAAGHAPGSSFTGPLMGLLFVDQFDLSGLPGLGVAGQGFPAPFKPHNITNWIVRGCLQVTQVLTLCSAIGPHLNLNDYSRNMTGQGQLTYLVLLSIRKELLIKFSCMTPPSTTSSKRKGGFCLSKSWYTHSAVIMHVNCVVKLLFSLVFFAEILVLMLKGSFWTSDLISKWASVLSLGTG